MTRSTEWNLMNQWLRDGLWRWSNWIRIVTNRTRHHQIYWSFINRSRREAFFTCKLMWHFGKIIPEVIFFNSINGFFSISFLTYSCYNYRISHFIKRGAIHRDKFGEESCIPFLVSKHNLNNRHILRKDYSTPNDVIEWIAER